MPATVPNAPEFGTVAITFPASCRQTSPPAEASPSDGPVSLLFRLRRLVVALAPHPLVEARRCATGNGDRGPAVAGQDSGDQDDLADMVAAMRQGALDRQRHGMRLAPDGH